MIGLGDATVRAVARDPQAEWRGRRLIVAGRPRPFATPHLLDVVDDTINDSIDDTVDSRNDRTELARVRGVHDAVGMLVRHSDADVHRSSSPERPLERIVFDALEQLRCESLTPAHLRGQRANLHAAFDAWTRHAMARRVAESRTSVLVFTTVQMARSRLSGVALSPEVDELTEAVRFELAPVVGHAMKRLRACRDDQRAFAEAALEIARLVAEVVGDAADDEGESDVADLRHRLTIPLDWAVDDQDVTLAAGDAPGRSPSPVASRRLDLTTIGDYRVFTTEFDREIRGDEVGRPEALRAIRRRLDERHGALTMSAPRLAARLAHRFAVPVVDGWSAGHEDGDLDRRRLSRLAVRPGHHDVFVQPDTSRTTDTAVAFLLDNSGSMKHEFLENMAVLVDALVRSLDLAGITNEVLGFTTGAWAGGRALDRWRRAGSPPDPGRMNEALHIVYKSADTPWRRSRLSLAALARTQHFREGLDGEAIVWAHRRLSARPESRKMLVLVTDGSPTDSATANVNRPGYLDDHLVGAVDRIERHHRRTRRGVELSAIAVGSSDTPSPVRRTVRLDLSGDITRSHLDVLLRLAER